MGTGRARSESRRSRRAFTSHCPAASSPLQTSTRTLSISTGRLDIAPGMTLWAKLGHVPILSSAFVAFSSSPQPLAEVAVSAPFQVHGTFHAAADSSDFQNHQHRFLSPKV